MNLNCIIWYINQSYFLKIKKVSDDLPEPTYYLSIYLQPIRDTSMRVIY